MPRRDEMHIDFVDASMTPSDIVDILQHLKFSNGRTLLQLDRQARDYLLASVTARHGSK
jgi:hypothetical protein